MTICERVFSLLADAEREQRELAEYIGGMAEFVCVSVDYILTGEEKEYRLSPADEEVLSAYHALKRPEQVYILSEMYRRAGLISSPADMVGEYKKTDGPESAVGSAV